ncbi:hypothetical protein PR003_g29116 [Phytophthora rubi]|uniref:FLYWCH-type domain-containing protein n=1 Tax=Phytophthora rubi TaxID=129364 RepID=A0A6A4BT70_9STRA|nr:hypothetical protein PR001_g23327 [Phytophthora rubi]KAE9276239.1 hypothetical protein PR003_g29116 [Phytophthora rubi]
MELLRSDSFSSQGSGDTESLPSDGASSATDFLQTDGGRCADEEETKDAEHAETTTCNGLIPSTGPVVYKGFFYAKYHETGMTTNYRCSSHKRTKCKAKLYVRTEGAIIQKGEHKSGCNRDIVRGTSADPVSSTTILAADILEAIDELAIFQPTLEPTEVWKIIRDKFYRNMNTIASGFNKTQVQGRFYRTKLKNFGNDVFVKIKSEPLCSVRENSDLKFFQYHGSYYEGDVLHHLVLWGHPALLDRLRARQT